MLSFKSLQSHTPDVELALLHRQHSTLPSMSHVHLAAIPWLQGIDNDAFKSPSQSLSGTALENLRRKRARSPSPVTSNQQLRIITKCNNADDDKPAVVIPSTQQTSMNEGVQERNVLTENIVKDHGHATAAAATTTAIKAIPTKIKATIPATCKGKPKSNKKSKKMDAENDTPSAGDTGLRADVISSAVPRGQKNLPALVVPQSPSQSTGNVLGDMSIDAHAKQKLDCILAKLDDDCEEDGLQKVAKNASGGCDPPGGRGRKKTLHVHRGQGDDVDVGAGGSKRRIPVRLLPWSCAFCTYENKGGDVKCEICQSARGAATHAGVATPSKGGLKVAKQASGGRGRKSTTCGGTEAIVVKKTRHKVGH